MRQVRSRILKQDTVAARNIVQQSRTERELELCFYAAVSRKTAAPMHDIGKIGIPDAILLKPGKLNNVEFETMKTHTTIGARILRGTSIPLLDLAEEIALGHHEKWGGSGYPQGISGEDIPEPARIVAVLDVYDALIHDRVYRPALPEDDALAIIAQGRGTHFAPEIYDAFLAVLPELRTIREELSDECQKPEVSES